LKPIRILIVDDFEPWRQAICSILAEDGDLKVVAESSDGLEAVQKSIELEPDLILLDIQLPTMNGLDAARQIRQISPRSKIVFLSSYRCVDTLREALKLGAAFIVKTDASRNLLPVLRAVIRNETFGSSDFPDSNQTETGQT
jgi:DNA-binding NarL/FixJ family response regulator